MLKVLARVLTAALVMTATRAWAANVGFETATVSNASGQKLDVGIWYPTYAASSLRPLGPYIQDVAVAAPLLGRALPLILISHGSGGWFGGHVDTAIALAGAGFIVAAVTHKGDSSGDGSHRAEIWMRPPQLKLVTDYMLTSWHWHTRVAADRIGVFGFSAGGFTALVAAGGTPNLALVLPYCKAHPDTQTCSVLKASPEALHEVATKMPVSVWVHDPRIRAASVAAPALGFTFGKNGLRGVHVPVQLWRAEDDHVLPCPDYADAVRKALPKPPDFHVVPRAGHYDFMTPCSFVLLHEAPEICKEAPGFDRAAFHISFNESVVAFFERTLNLVQ